MPGVDTSADLSGEGSVVAARMAVEDFGAADKNMNVEVISADHQNKPDIASNIARQWYDQDGVDAILDVPTSSTALAVADITAQANKILIDSGAGRKLERFGTIVVDRPEPQALWHPRKGKKVWDAADAVFSGSDDEDAEGTPVDEELLRAVVGYREGLQALKVADEAIEELEGGFDIDATPQLFCDALAVPHPPHQCPSPPLFLSFQERFDRRVVLPRDPAPACL
jgi:hypothetical protein